MYQPSIDWIQISQELLRLSVDLLIGAVGAYIIYLLTFKRFEREREINLKDQRMFYEKQIADQKAILELQLHHDKQLHEQQLKQEKEIDDRRLAEKQMLLNENEKLREILTLREALARPGNPEELLRNRNALRQIKGMKGFRPLLKTNFYEIHPAWVEISLNVLINLIFKYLSWRLAKRNEKKKQ